MENNQIFSVKVKKVKKRDGRIVDFDLSRISTAIEKAMKAVGKYDANPVSYTHLTLPTSDLV